ncbi:MAG: iron-sulfur cluster assembly scaffold protein [Salaquimonas sp.]
MLDDVYNAKIIEYAGNIPRIGRLDAPDATAKAHSKLCGSTVIVDLKMEEQNGALTVTDFAHDVKACALGQASSSIMARNIIGATAAELKQLKKQAYAMLKDGAPAPEGKFAEFKFLEPVREYKARHASTLLTFDAVVDCVEEIEANLKAAKREKQATAKRHAMNALSGAGIRFRVK